MLKHPTGMKITDNIPIKHYSMAQFKIGAFPLITRSYLQLSLTLCGPYAILHMSLTYIFHIYNVIFNYLLICVLKNLSISSPRFWAALHPTASTRCKQFYIRRKEGGKTITYRG